MKFITEEELNNDEAKQFYDAVARLKSSDEVANFLRDVLTFQELDEAISRFRAAKLLTEGVGVRQVARETKMSSATISRINWWLHHGTGGYGLALKARK